MLSKHEIVTNILPDKAQIQLHGYIFFFFVVIMKAKTKRLDLFRAVFLLITIISACVPHFYLLGYDRIFPPKGTTEGRF